MTFPGRALRAVCTLLVLVAAQRAAAQSPPVPGLYFHDWYDVKAREAEATPSEFRLINYFFTRGSLTNQLADPSGLKGVSLGPIGSVAGSSTQVGGPGPAAYVEQRWIPVFEYSPFFVDGLASFRAQMEVDYVWGRSANTVQQNEGGGFNADQINIQTKNVNVAIYPTRDPDELSIVIGTQPVYDNPLDPTRASLYDLTRTGYKLAFLGSDATGLSLFTSKWGRGRLSFLPLGSIQADKPKGDPRLKFVYLGMADWSQELAPGTWLGASLWHMRDDTKGQAFAFEGLVRSGPASGGLSSFTGTQPFNIRDPSGHITWAGLNAHHNIDFKTGPFGASGFVMYNWGRFRSTDPARSPNAKVDVSGLSGNLELLYNWGRTTNDVVSVQGMYTSPDDNPLDDHYTGAFTLNYYGLPGAVWFDHKSLILFPFTSTVNNYTGAVTDISNQGLGLAAVIGAAAWDVVPNKLNVKVGAAHARALATPAVFPGSSLNRGRIIGTELNAEVRYHVRYLMTVGLHGAYMFRGLFYQGETSRVTESPFALFSTFTWYAF